MQKANVKLKIIILIQAIALLILLYTFKQSSLLQDGISPGREKLNKKYSNVEGQEIINAQIQINETAQSNTDEAQVRMRKPAPTPTLEAIGNEHNDTKRQTTPKMIDSSAEVPINRVLNNYSSYPDMKPLELSCKTCAFVTSSGHLTGKGLGAEIDSKDCVFRSNDAPIAGYEADVGSRTTIRTVDERSLKFLVKNYLKNETNYPRLKETAVIFVTIFNVDRSLSNATRMLPFLKTYYISMEMCVTTNNHFKVEVLNATKIEMGQWTSNGFATIVIAHDICNEIHVYGITEPNHCEKVATNEVEDVPYHYYKDKAQHHECHFFNMNLKMHTDHHLFSKEKIAFKNLQRKWGNIFFHAPEWEGQTAHRNAT